MPNKPNKSESENDPSKRESAPRTDLPRRRSLYDEDYFGEEEGVVGEEEGTLDEAEEEDDPSS